MKKIEKTDREWQETLTSEQYHVCREKGTEPPFTGKYAHTKDDGTYKCVCCGAELFDSATKYDSGTGWPSFFQPIDKQNITEEDDTSFGMHRVEVMCSACGAHLGHVFPDGPKPTGMRYCINSAALDLEKKDS